MADPIRTLRGITGEVPVWHEPFFDRYIDVTLYSMQATDNTGNPRPLARADVNKYDWSAVIRGEESLCNNFMTGKNNTSISMTKIRTPRSGVKPNITLSMTLLPNGRASKVNLSIANFNSELDLVQFQYMHIRAGYRSSPSACMDVQCEIFNAYQEKPNPEGATVFQGIVSTDSTTGDSQGNTLTQSDNDRLTIIRKAEEGSDIFSQWYFVNRNQDQIYHWDVTNVPDDWKKLKPVADDPELLALYSDLQIAEYDGAASPTYTLDKVRGRKYLINANDPCNPRKLQERLQAYFNKVAQRLNLPYILIYIRKHNAALSEAEHKSRLAKFKSFVSGIGGVRVPKWQVAQDATMREWWRNNPNQNVWLAQGVYYYEPTRIVNTYTIHAEPVNSLSETRFKAVTDSPAVVYLDKVTSAFKNVGQVQVTAPWNPYLSAKLALFVMDARFFRGGLASNQGKLITGTKPTNLYKTNKIDVSFSTQGNNQMVVEATEVFETPPPKNEDPLQEPPETEEVRQKDERPPASRTWHKNRPPEDLPDYYEVQSGDSMYKIIVDKFNWTPELLNEFFPESFMAWIGGTYDKFSVYNPDFAGKRLHSSAYDSGTYKADGTSTPLTELTANMTDVSGKGFSHSLQIGDRIYFRPKRQFK